MNATVELKQPSRSDESSFDYARIEKAIIYLHANFRAQPELADVARAVHLSEYHFQRVFTRWAGISPKRFLQFLTVDFAKRQLAASTAILEVALDSGLSGPGRLHDLFTSVEAVTPGEFKSRGRGVEIQYGFQPSPFGLCLIGATARGISWLSFTPDNARETAICEMKSHWRGARFSEAPEVAARVSREVFSNLGRSSRAPLSLLLMGTNFQLQVWRALLKIPPGTVVSYATLGSAIGHPEAPRAIGNAVGANALAYLIPCHRVIRQSGALGGYRWGEPRKRAILAWEAAWAKAKVKED